jgi:hypothetical protein
MREIPHRKDMHLNRTDPTNGPDRLYRSRSLENRLEGVSLIEFLEDFQLLKGQYFPL